MRPVDPVRLLTPWILVGSVASVADARDAQTEANPPRPQESMEEAEQAEQVKGAAPTHESPTPAPNAPTSVEGVAAEPARAVPPPDQTALAEELERERDARVRWAARTEAEGLPDRAEVVGLTVAGGVSLGSYEAGQVFLLTDALRSVPGSARLMVATGASAGNANALIGATEACLPPNANGEASLGYRIWVDVGFDDLFDEKRVTSQSIFVQDALSEKFDLIKKAWQSGLPSDCEFVFGLAVTRKHGIDVELAEGLTVPRQASRMVVHVKGRDGKAPIFRNYLDPNVSYKRALLPLSDGRDPTAERDAEAIRPAVLASAAFPVAFEPVSIPHCTTAGRTERGGKSPDESDLSCAVATRVDQFVDGGVFDNNPLGITFKVAHDGIVGGADGPTFRPAPTGGPEPVPESIYGYIDPDLRSYAVHQVRTTTAATKDPLLGIIASLGGEILSSSRGQELASLAERSPEALDRLWLVRGNYPPVSELLGAFFGFFERDFRDFDFHLGTYDTYRALRAETATILGTEPYVEALEREFSGSFEQVPKAHAKLGCMLAHFEPDASGRLAPLCARTSHNFRALLQLAILRLWSNCRLLSEDEASVGSHLECRKARGGLPPPLVDPAFEAATRDLQGELEGDFDYGLRILEKTQFHFKDLGLEQDQAGRARLAIRRVLADAVHALANAQPGFSERTLVMTAGRTMVNDIAYEPPPHRWYVLVGTSLATGYLGRVGELRAWHYNLDGRLYNLRSLLTDRSNQFGGAVSAGAELALLPLSGNIFQTSLGLRFGYQMTAEDSIGIDPCTEESTGGDSRLCSQPLIQVPVNLTLLERVRLAVTPLFYPVGEEFGHNVFDLEIGLGAELF